MVSGDARNFMRGLQYILTCYTARSPNQGFGIQYRRLMNVEVYHKRLNNGLCRELRKDDGKVAHMRVREENQ